MTEQGGSGGLGERPVDDVLEAVPVPLAVHDPETGEFRHANERYARLLGHDRDRLVGRPYGAVAADREAFGAAAFRDLLSDPPPDAVAWRFRRGDGSTLAVECTVGRGAFGDAPVALVAVRASHDAGAVADLAEYRRRLEGAMAAGEVAWWEMDVRTGAVEFEDRKATMLGYDPDRFHHYEDFTDLVHPEDHDRAMAAMRDHLEGREPRYEVEYRLETADGDYRWLHDAGSVTARDERGRPERATGIVVDVTKRKRAERRLERQNRELALLNRVVRHDIGNEMNVVVGWLEQLRGEVPPDVRDRFDRVLDASRHVVDLTDDVRDLVRLIEEGREPELSPVPLVPVLEDQVEHLRSIHPAASVELSVVGDREATVRANSMLASVFRNLLTNAVEHSDVDAPTVDVSVEASGADAVVRVADDGPGVSDDLREAMTRGTADLERSGVGVGLHLVASLVEAYGGRVRVTDNEPRGAVFTVALPRADR
ncbi:MAG: PAS domain-containing protein [Halobacteriaceae archaeon]